MTQINIQTQIESWIQDHELSHWGWKKLAAPVSFDFYSSWIDSGNFGEMSYLKEHLPIKKNPLHKYGFAKSYLSFAQPYWPAIEEPSQQPKHLRVAMYARGNDYHFWFKEKLEKIAEKLKILFPGETFLCATDSQPLLERDMGFRAGLGWFGKNTCLIHPKKGSLFFLGEILSSVDFEFTTAPLPDFCGTCTRCMDVCPTQALTSERVLNATKCISYWTIESKTVAPIELREKFGDHFFGCDLCQTVCPWNQKVFKGQLEIKATRDFPSDEAKSQMIDELRDILTSSSKSLEKKWLGSPLSRARGFGLKRNALVVIGNCRFMELKTDVLAYSDHPRLGELARWTLSKLTERHCS